MNKLTWEAFVEALKDPDIRDDFIPHCPRCGEWFGLDLALDAHGACPDCFGALEAWARPGRGSEKRRRPGKRV